MTIQLDDIAITASSVSEADVTQLTTISLQGTGVFDKMIRVTKLHLQEEFDEGRITGEEYATVFLGAFTSVLQQSVAFILNHQTAEKITAEIGLVRQKTVTELAQTDNTIPLGLGFNGDGTIEGMVESKLSLEAKQEDLVDTEIISKERDNILTGQKIITEFAQTADTLTTAANAYALNIDDSVIAGVIGKEQDKLDEEIRFAEQKLVTEIAQTSDTKPTTLGEMNTTDQITGIVAITKDKITADIAKLDEEIILLAQKAMTELAQTSNALPAGTSALNANTTLIKATDSDPEIGLTGEQKALFAAQTHGFGRDAEQKAAKILVDAWTVSATLGHVTANANNQLTDVSVGTVIELLKEGMGIEPAHTDGTNPTELP